MARKKKKSSKPETEITEQQITVSEVERQGDSFLIHVTGRVRVKPVPEDRGRFEGMAVGSGLDVNVNL